MMLLRACQFEFRFPRPALVMGIVNVTPDSFSDGGQFLSPTAAVAHALKLIEEGADIIDIGGESTRPHAAPVGQEEELRRILPVLEQLVGQVRVPLSVDTMKPAVARAALQAGASLINDVAANRADPEMWRVAAEAGAGYVLLHMQGTPQTMQHQPAYRDVVTEVKDFFADRVERLAAAGVKSEHVVLDVGMGFGKTAEHNLQLLARLAEFRKWNRPLLLGLSRKSFLSSYAQGAEVGERLPGSLAGACWGVQVGANIIRAHDVAATRQALRLTEAILAQSR